jgi:hypothetical protein
MLKSRFSAPANFSQMTRGARKVLYALSRSKAG